MDGDLVIDGGLVSNGNLASDGDLAFDDDPTCVCILAVVFLAFTCFLTTTASHYVPYNLTALTMVFALLQLIC
jgi:hypothetical protein